VILNRGIQNEPERVHGIVEILASDFRAEIGRPLLTLFRRNLVDALLPEFRPSEINFPNADRPVVLAPFLEGSVIRDVFLEPLHGFGEEGKRRAVRLLLLLFLEEINELESGVRSDVRLQALTNNLAAGFDPCKICPTAGVLQQVWDVPERTPFPVLRKTGFAFSGSSILGCR